MESAIGVVYLEVSPLGAIDFNMNSVHRHSMWVCTEDSWLVHVVPKRVNVIWTLEDVVTEETAPEVLRVLI